MNERPYFAVNCEHCGVDLNVVAIVDGERRAGHREVGHVYHDLVQFWSCPDCGGTWPRFAPQHPYYPLAEKLRTEWDRIQSEAKTAWDELGCLGTQPRGTCDCVSCRAVEATS